MQHAPQQLRLERLMVTSGTVAWRVPRPADERRRSRLRRHDAARRMLHAR